MTDSETHFPTESSHSFGPSPSYAERMTATTDATDKMPAHNNRESSRSREIDTTFERFYQFGKIFFGYVLAEPFYRAAHPTAGAAELDAGLQCAQLGFKYAAFQDKIFAILASEELAEPHCPQSGGQYVRLMASIGVVALSGDAGAKRGLTDAIRACSSPINKGKGRTEAMPPSPPSSSDEDETDTIHKLPQATPRWQPTLPRDDPRSSLFHQYGQRPSPSCNTDNSRTVRLRDESNMGSYATRLKEWGDRGGNQVFQPEAEKTSDDRSAWREIVHVNGMTFEGVARTKKEARLRASRDACIHLGI